MNFWHSIGTVMRDKTSSGRIEYIDLARAFGIWIMVSFHLMRKGPYTNLMNLMVLPVFFYLTGYVRIVSGGVRHISFGRYTLKRAYNILIPYFLVGLISILVFQALGSYAGGKLGVRVNTSLPANLLNLLYGSGKNGAMKWNESLWFLPCIFCMNLIEEIIERILPENTRSANMFRVCAAILCLIAGRLLVSREIALPWHLETALSNMIWTEAGVITAGYPVITTPDNTVVRTGRMVTRVKIGRLIVIALSFCSIVFLAPHLGKVSFRTDEFDHYPVALLCGAACIILIMTVSMTVQQFCAGAGWLRIPESAGRRSLDIMLWNKFPVLFCQIVIPLMMPGFEKTFLENNTRSGVIVCLLMAIPCMMLCLLWEDTYKIIIKKCSTKLLKLNKNL